MDPEGGGAGGPDPLKNHKHIGFLSKTDPDPLKNHKAAKPAFNNGPSLAEISGIWIHSSTKNKTKRCQKLDPLCKNFLDPRMSFQQTAKQIAFVVNNI